MMCYLSVTNSQPSLCTLQLSPEGDKSEPVYVVVVQCAADGPLSSGTAEGWVVMRKLKDFQTLHAKLKEVREQKKTSERTHARTHARTHVRTSERTRAQTNESTNEPTN